MHPFASTTTGSSLLHQLDSITERVELNALFPQPQPIELELGAGDGSFIVEYARRHPERNFLGLERLYGRLRKIDRKGRRLGLTNLRGIRIEAEYFLEYLLPENTVAAIHVYFPDPWPKRKHRKNRLIQERFTALAHRGLIPGGVVYLRTDDADYFQQMLEVFAADSRFKKIETPGELSDVVTDFERGFLVQGIQTNRAAYQREP